MDSQTLGSLNPNKPSTKYTEKQIAFLDNLQKTGSIDLAYEASGYKSSNKNFILRDLRTEIIEIANITLASYAPKAAMKMGEVLDSNVPIPQVNAKIQAAQNILDRVGIVKEAKVSVDHNVSGGIFILPSKESLVGEGEVIEDAEYS